MSGNVYLIQDTVHLKSDRALFYKEKNIAFLYGKINIRNGKNQFIRSDRAIYKGHENKAELYANVSIKDSVSTTTGDKVFYFKDSKFTEIFGNGKVVETTNNIEILGDYISSLDRKKVNVYGNAEFYQKTDSLELFADTLILNRLTNISTAINSVRIFQKDIECTGDFALFNHTDSTLALRGNASVKFQSNEVLADSIFIVFKQKSVESLDAINNAITTQVYNKEESKVNRFEGRNIYITMKNKKMDKMRSVHNAISLFYFEDDKGINSITADSIHVFFKHNDVDHVKEYGGVDGTFYPPGYRGTIKNAQ